MIKRFSLVKIMKMSILLLVLLLLYIFPSKKDYELNTNMVNTNNNYHDIYLLNNKGYVSKTTIAISSLDKEKIANDLLNSLIINGNNKNKVPEGFIGTIPNKAKIDNIKIDNECITVSFSEEIKNNNDKDKMIESIVYTLTSIKGINKVYLKIDM